MKQPPSPPIEVLAYSAFVFALISLVDANVRGSLLWWTSYVLIVLGLVAINHRYRRTCALLEEARKRDPDPK